MVSVFGVSRFLLVLLSSISCAIAQDLICGTLGYHDEVNLYYYMGNFFYNGLTSFTLYAAYCQQDTKREAFRYSYWSDADAHYCEFFHTSIAGNFAVGDTSPYYYDIGNSFLPLGTPVTVTSFSILTSTISHTSFHLFMVTSFVTTTSTLPAVTRISTIVGAAVTKTRNATSTSTQTLVAQTVSASFVAIQNIITTQTLPAQTSTVLCPTMTNATSTAVYSFTAIITATVTPQAIALCPAQATQAPSPSSPQTVTKYSTRTFITTTTDIRCVLEICTLLVLH